MCFYFFIQKEKTGKCDDKKDGYKLLLFFNTRKKQTNGSTVWEYFKINVVYDDGRKIESVGKRMDCSIIFIHQVLVRIHSFLIYDNH